MKYIVSYSKPNNHYIAIEYIIDNIKSDRIKVQLPAWRPGRYELANFSKNIQQWQVSNSKKETLPAKKIKKDLWEIETKEASSIHIKYNYFANEINAGSSYLDSKQLYINGVNCFLYVPERINETCELSLIVPKDYEVATGLTKNSKHEFTAKNFHELVDCPLIASNSLQHHQYTVNDVTFHLWFQGECKPNWELLENDFKKFSTSQIKALGSFPVSEYHFLFQILTHKAYHGVEHTNSTVIALGPSYELMKKEGGYLDLLGVSSHELYHTWNVKQIRPAAMYPYDYSKENYTVMGYLTEGITTYYGDKYLLIAQVFDWSAYTKTFNELLARHFNNFGANNYSVAQSSFDTWLDGYVKGVPNRKSSIYTEGALIAFMTDIFIMQNTNNQKSLNDVMIYLYDEFAKKQKGVTDTDYKEIVEEIAGYSFDEIYKNYLHGTKDYTKKLQESFDYIGCKLVMEPNRKFNEAYLGFKVKYNGNKCIVDAIFPNSIAEENGLSINDEIIAINGIKVTHNLTEWCLYFKGEEISLSVKRVLGKIEKIRLNKSPEVYYKSYSITKTNNNSKNFDAWVK